MSEALVALDNLPVSPYADFSDELTKGLNFYPRLQLCGSSTELAKSGKISVNHYALIRTKEDFDDMSKSVTVLPLSMRPKALDTSGDSPITVFDPASPEFKRIYDQSSVKDSGCMAGLEFLIWLPDSKKYATFYFSAPTARPEAANMKQRLGLACTLDSRMAKNKKGQTWVLPVVKPYSSPIDLPSPESIQAECLKFTTEKASEVTVAADDSGRER